MCALVTGVYFFFKQKTAYEMRISDWSSDVCSSDLGELVVPLLSDLPLVQKLTVEGAYRRSWYEKSVGDDRRYDTNKLGINWIVSDDLRLRGTRQTVIRDANLGDFATPVSSIPFATIGRASCRERVCLSV